MNDEPRRRSSALLAIAAGMGVTLVALIVWTALSQNRFGLVATIQAYDAVDGSERWTAQFDVDHPPRLFSDGVLFVSEEALTALGGDGDVQWHAPVPGFEFAERAGDYVAVQVRDRDDGNKVVLLDATNGTVLWEQPGTMRHLGTEIVAIRRHNEMFVLASRSGEQIARLENPGRNNFIAGDTTAAALTWEKLTVYTADGDPIDIVSNLLESPQLEAIDDDVVALSRMSDKPGRIVEGYDIATGAQVWQESLADYERPAESSNTERLFPIGNGLVIVVTTGNPGGDGAWMVTPAEGPPEAIAAVGEELTPIEGGVRYFFVDGQTFAVDAVSHEVLWTDSGRFPAAATEGLAAIKHKKRYTIVSAATGETVAKVPRKGGWRIRGAGGRFVVDTGPKIVVVEPDGTLRDLYEQRARLEAASAQYAVVSKGGQSSSGDIQVAVLDLATGAEVFDQPFERAYGISLDGEMMVIRHWESATTVDLTTGETTNTEMPNVRQNTGPPDYAVVVFDPDRTRLLWTTEMSGYSSVRAIGDKIVIATPRPKHP